MLDRCSIGLRDYVIRQLLLDSYNTFMCYKYRKDFLDSNMYYLDLGLFSLSIKNYTSQVKQKHTVHGRE